MKKWLIGLVLILACGGFSYYWWNFAGSGQESPGVAGSPVNSAVPRESAPASAPVPNKERTIPSVNVVLDHARFEPAQVRIKAGEGIMIDNPGQVPLTISGTNLPEMTLDPVSGFGRSISQAGVYEYTCKEFPAAKLVVTVE